MYRPTFTPIYFPPITRRPSYIKTKTPSNTPSHFPSQFPSQIPLQFPSIIPTQIPSITPSIIPTQTPSQVPTQIPSIITAYIPSINSTNKTIFIITLQVTNSKTSSFQISIVIGISIFFIFCMFLICFLYEYYKRIKSEKELNDWIEARRIKDIERNILKPINFIV